MLLSQSPAWGSAAGLGDTSKYVPPLCTGTKMMSYSLVRSQAFTSQDSFHGVPTGPLAWARCMCSLKRGSNSALSPFAATGSTLQFAGVNPVCIILHIAPCGRTLKPYPLDQGPARCALDAYVPRLIISPSS